MVISCASVLNIEAQDTSSLQRLVESHRYREAIELADSLDDTVRLMADTTKCDFYYLLGVSCQAVGDTALARRNFELECNLSEQINRRDLSYIDGVCRLINIAHATMDYNTMAGWCQRGAMTPYSVMSQYPQAPWFYESYVASMNALGKISTIQSIVKDGMRYVNLHFTPADKRYYTLYFADIIAYMLMGRYEQADAELREIIAIHNSSGVDVVGHELATLQSHVDEKAFDWRNDKDSEIQRCMAIGQSLLLNGSDSPDGAEKWTAYFKLLQDKLKYLYFDTSDRGDEEYWNKLLSTLIAYFSTVGDNLPDRAQVAYDNILIRKNFLDYHSSKLHKKPTAWQDVRNSLSSNEAAIELTICPDEILILRPDYHSPISVPVDSVLIDKISRYNAADAVAISSFYREGSPLFEVWRLIEPYIDGCTTVYLSPSNNFAQFNFDAVAEICGDRINLVQLTTTADIDYFKSSDNNLRRLSHTAAVFGGIDYGNAKVAVSRGSFGYLPHSLQESKEIAEILRHSGFDVKLYTDKNATKQQFTSLGDSAFDIVHVATHAYCDGEVVDDSASETRAAKVLSKSGLLFAEANEGLKEHSTRGILTANEIASLNLSGIYDMVLSGCSSAMGDLTNTTGLVYGVVNALKSSGVREIIATLWDLPDELASIAMQRYYTHFAETADASVALRKMRQDLIDLGYNDPYYWANFVLIH